MPQAVTHTFEVDQEGKVTAPKRLRWMFTDYLKQYAGSEVEVELRPPKRTGSQNRYYWGVLLDVIHQAHLCAGVPMTKEALHTAFKQVYLGSEIVEVFGREVVQIRSTTKLDKTEFHYYLEAIREDEQVRELLARTGLYIPDADEYQAEHGRFRGHTIAEPT